MDRTRVDSLVDGLASAFEAGLDFYAKWKKKQERVNHYRKQDSKSSTTATKCALSTSLDISSHRIKATYQVGFALIGPEFSSGDPTCRECLSANLRQLEERIDLLRQAVITKNGGPLNLHELFQASDSIRARCVSALAEQYSRLAVGRAVPQELPIPKLPRTAVARNDRETAAVKVLPAHERIEFDRQTAVWSTSSGPPAFQSEPPSPPPTPKLLPPDDVQSIMGPPSEIGQPSGRQPLRPNNSVFSIFCPEAMALQVDPARPVPSRKCRCGYRWKKLRTDELAHQDQQEALLLKEGFRMTRRFLAKSHCDQTTPVDEGVVVGGGGGGGGGAPTGQGRPGYGCVLCTSTGCAETYETAGLLRTHINATHTKWQMLHDRDMT